ncbi:hypothetical protein [Paraburkholderia sp. 35.1]|uniref:hypothetical protein n=1 Tax=Paraburkholderia sp. 35.1 TaxID=2991058 RepID=UPI003D1A2AAB
MSKHVPTAQAVASTTALWLLLKQALSTPAEAPPALVIACATQVTLSRYKNASKEIFPLALNTLKSAAATAVQPGGWDELESLRKRVARLRTSWSPKLKRTRGIREKLEQTDAENAELKRKVQNLLRGRSTLLSAYMDTIEILRVHAHLSPALVARLSEHEAIFNIRTLSNVGGQDGN